MITLYNEKDQKVKIVSTYEVNDADMGESSISITVAFDKEQDFHPDWYVLYEGERYRLGVRKPTGRKDTSSLSTSYTLVFKSEREDLKRYTFMNFVELGTGNPQPSSYKVSLYVTLSQFVDIFNTNLHFYLGGRWQMVLPNDYVEDNNYISASFDDASLWDVLLKFYEMFGLRWVIRNDSNTLKIQVGFKEIELEHIFEYGKDNGLVSVERNNALERIITRLRGRGGEKNLPPDYFHKGDPDTNSFLQSTYFSNLMPKSYRDYIRGYNNGFGSGSWAYNQGVTDKLSGKDMTPIDYAISDKEELWGVSYGSIEPNDGIYPTLQGFSRNGVRLDEVLSVEEIAVDGIREPENIVQIGIGYGGSDKSFGKCGDGPKNYQLPDCRTGIQFPLYTDKFQVTNPVNTAGIRINLNALYTAVDGTSVPIDFDTLAGEGYTGTVNYSAVLQLYDYSQDIIHGQVIKTQSISDVNNYTWVIENLAPGTYSVRTLITWRANLDRPDAHYTEADVVVTIDATLTSGSVKEYARPEDKGEWKSTFDIDIRDVWDIARETDESDKDYTYRVWSPRAVSEDMTVMFSDGLLAGEDYEFRIVGFNVDSDNLYEVITNAIKPIENGWRLTLEKSEAEAQASNTYLPNTKINAKPGDHFFFVNIAMPYNPYVYDAEERVQAYLDEQLGIKDEEFPSFTITPSKIFCSNFNEVGKIKCGAKIRVRNTALVGDSYVSLYIQSLTKRYNANSLNPEWNLTISDKVVASGNPVSLLEGQIDILNQRVYANRQAVQEAVRSLSGTFLRKDGIKDVSYSPTEFKKRIELGDGVADVGFNRGDITGRGFGVYTDEQGRRVIEADLLVGRVGARFNEVQISQVTYIAGKQIFSAAGMIVSRVDGNRCYFDTKNGSIRNGFAVNDGAFSERFADAGIRSYWVRVVAVGPDWIELAANDVEPLVGDNIAQLGNSTDKSRQAALIIDEVRDGGGLVTWYDDIDNFTLSDKDSVNIGRIEGKTWLKVFGSAYIGTRNQDEYVKYEDGKVSIKGSLEVGTKLGGQDLKQLIDNATPEGYDEFVAQVTKDLQGLQQQVDGAIESYFFDYEPTLNNYPANEWDTDDEKAAHLNDTFTNLSDGRSWRWTTNGWVEITDTATTKALELAGKAQDTADSKRRVFITTPYTPYSEGDLWAGGSDMPLKRCINSKDSGAFSESDWDYADNTQTRFAGLEYLKEALKESTTVDGGLIQSALLMLGYTVDGVFKVMSGTNGVYRSTEKGGGIAAWYGGPMADKEADSSLVDFAQSLFRFDGSGYLAGGNITWDKDGAGSVAGGNIAWDKNGVVTFASEIKIGGGIDTLGTVINSVTAIKRDYLPLIGGTISGKLKIAGTLVIPTSEPTDLSQGEVGFYLGTAGQGAEEPNGSGGLDLTELWAELGSEDYAKKIHISHIPTIQYSSIAGRPSALVNPYALTINGVVYDGSEPISLDISAGGGVADAVAWGNVFNKPSTISGYGITDAYTKDSVDLKLSGYLPKSGGILDSGSGQVPLILNSVGETTRLAYRKNGTTLGYLGFSGVDNPVFINAAGGSRKLLHQDNYHYYALPVSGGTINGTLEINHNSTYPLIVNGADSYSVLQFFARSKRKAEVGWLNDSRGDFAFLLNVNSMGALSVNEHGAYFAPSASDFAKYPILHSGNYSNYALPLSGGVVKGISPYHQYIVEIDTDNEFYSIYGIKNKGVRKGGLLWSKDSKHLIGVSIFNVTTGDYLGLSDAGSPMYNSNTLIHSGNIGSQRVANADTLDDLHAADFAKAKRYVVSGTDVNSIGYGHTNDGNMYVGPIATFGTATYFIEIQSPYNKPELYYRQHNANGYSDIKQLAFTDSNITGNAASATKLQTARTIWGQSFDGSGNVSGIAYFPNGDLIYAKDEGGTYRYVMGLTSGLSFGYGSASAGIDTYILGKNIHFRYYDTDYKYAMSIQNNGNVLIGTTTDNGYKLQVNGTLKANGLIIPTSAPTDLKSGDHALYLGSIGEGAELPSGVGGLDVAELWAELAKVDESKQINVSHIPTIEIARVSGLQTILNNKADASALSSYLLKSGGTISSSSVVPLTVNSTGDNTRIAFKQNGNTLGYFAFAKANTPLFIDNEGGRYTMFHSGNFNPADYLPKSGGTMSGYISWQNNVNGNDIADWDAERTNFGLKILSAGGGSTSVPTKYATALQVRGRYGFQIASNGGAYDIFYIKNIAVEGREWKELYHTGNLTKLSQLTDDVVSGKYQPLITNSNKLAYSLISGVPTSLPASDVYAWAKASVKPTYTASEVGALSESGGIVRGVITLSGNSVTNVPLNIATPSMGYTGYIRFGGGFDTHELGHLGFSAKGVPAMRYEGVVNILYHTGNFNPADYLPLSGGTITGGFGVNRNNTTENPNIALSNNNGTAWLGYNVDADSWFVTNKNWYNTYTIIHSGNIGSQSVASANRLVTSDGKYIMYVESTNNRLYIGDNINATTDTFILGKSIQMRYGSNGTRGFTLNSSGNVTIGASDLASTTTKLYVDGGIRFAPRTIWGQSFDGTANVDGAATFTFNDGQRIIIEKKSGGSNYCGISFFNNGFKEGCITASTLLLNPVVGGNVLIGTTKDNGYKLEVNGTLKAGSSTLASLAVSGNIINNNYKLYSGTINPRLELTDGTTTMYAQLYNSQMGIGPGSGKGLYIKINGYIGVNTNAPEYPLDVNGSARIGTNLVVTGNTTLGGNLEVGTTDSCYIALKRNSLNYFHATGASGYIGFITNAKGTSRANCDLLIQDTLVCAGITEHTDLGSTTYRWKGINAKTLNLSSDAKISGEMDANALVIPTAPPTNPQAGKHYLYLA